MLERLLQSPLRPLLSPLGNALKWLFSPSMLFSAGQQGAWYDPSDFSTLFQDSAGTTPVTAVEQPLGKSNDKSGRGNHATQATAASRPVLSARVNLLTKTDLLTDAAWTVIDAAPVKNQANSAGAPNSAWLVTEGSAGTSLVKQNGGFAAGVLLTESIVLKAGTSTWVRLLLRDSSESNGCQQWFNLSTGAVGAAGAVLGSGTAFTSGITTEANGFYRCWLSCKLDAASTSGGVRVLSASADGAGRVNNSTYVIESPQLETGPTATRYQRVNTATDYDTAGFPLYEKLDGVDDSLSSATGGGGTAGFFFCAAVKVLGGAGTAREIWNDRVGTNGYIVRANTLNNASLLAGNGSFVTQIATGASSLLVGETRIVTAWDDGSTINIQIDRGTVSSVARPAVSAGSNSFTVGKHNETASNFFPGNIYAAIYVKDSGLTATQRALVQRHVASKAGIAL